MLISFSRRLATKSIFFHGTSTIFLRSILKHGLQANPLKRVWDEQSDTSSCHTSLTSLGGVYVTPDLYDANVHATTTTRKLGGSNLIVIIEGQIRSGLHDEDTLRGSLELSFFQGVGRNDLLLAKAYAEYLCLTHGVKSSTDFYKQEKQKFNKRFVNLLEEKIGKLPPVRIPDDIFDIMLRRTVKHMSSEGHDMVYEIERNLKVKIGTDIDILEITGSPVAEDKIYLERLDLLTRILKRNLPTGKSLRFPCDITFKGANRIVAIVEPNQGKVHYGTVTVEYEKLLQKL